MEDFAENDTREINPVKGDGCLPTIHISGPLVEDDVDNNEMPPELPARSTPKIEPNSPEHKDAAHKDLIYADSKHKPMIKIEPAHTHATKSTSSPPVRSPLALSVDFSDEKIPALPARRRLSQPNIMPLGKQAAELYVNTSVSRVTVSPFTWKSAEPTGNDGKVDAYAYKPVETGECMLSEAIGNVKTVSKGNTYENKIISSEKDVIFDISPVTASDLITQNLNKCQNIKSDNMEKITNLSINEIGDILRLLKLDEYVEIFKQNHVDGAILTSLEREDLVNELGMKKLEATRLVIYMSEGHIPKMIASQARASRECVSQVVNYKFIECIVFSLLTTVNLGRKVYHELLHTRMHM